MFDGDSYIHSWNSIRIVCILLRFFLVFSSFTFEFFEMSESIYLNNESIYYDFIYNIKRNKLRMLEENELELATKRHEQSLNAEQQHISNESFVNDLDKHQLFESLFVNNLDSNVMDTDSTDM